MAWFVKHSLLREDNPKIELDETDRSRILDSCREVIGSLSKTEVDNSIDLARGHMSASSGLILPVRKIEVKLNVISSYGPLPDILATRVGYVVRQRVMDLIEDLEPSVHQFLPAQVIGDPKNAPEDRWTLLNVCNRLDTISAEQSAGIEEVWPDKDRLPQLSMYVADDWRLPVYCHKARIEGRALWFEYKLHMMGTSDRFADKFMSESLRGLEFHHFKRHPRRALEI